MNFFCNRKAADCPLNLLVWGWEICKINHQLGFFFHFGLNFTILVSCKELLIALKLVTYGVETSDGGLSQTLTLDPKTRFVKEKAHLFNFEANFN